MGAKTRTPTLASKTSAAADPKSTAQTQASNTSSILKSAFIPSHFQLSLFASVIQSFDSQLIRLHHTSGRLQCEHTLEPGVAVTCLTWGYYGTPGFQPAQKENSRKRKRSSQANGTDATDKPGDVVLAFGTNSSDIWFYSPSEAKVVKTLQGGHSSGVRDFKFINEGRTNSAWSVGGDGQLALWDTWKGRVIK